MYDVIVIGAGPAGSTAAHELVSHGYQVLLVERKPLPRNKSCSGILIKKSMDLVQKYFGEAVLDHTCCTPYDNRGMVLFTDTGKELRFEQPGRNIWRSSFDNWLTTKAVAKGAHLRTQTAATGYEETSDYIRVRLHSTDGTSKRYTEEARMVILCTGAASSFGPCKGKTQAPVFTYQTFCRGSIDLDPHYFYAYLQPRFSQYDAWLNVKDDYLIFGVASKDAKTIPAYHREFLSYMETTYRAKRIAQDYKERWIMPSVQPGCPVNLGQGRVLLAGEAAGFLNPMGEGISSGMESGYHAAHAIIEANIGHRWNEQVYDSIHTTYRRKTEELHKYMRRQWDFIGHTSGTFSHMKDSGKLL